MLVEGAYVGLKLDSDEGVLVGYTYTGFVVGYIYTGLLVEGNSVQGATSFEGSSVGSELGTYEVVVTVVGSYVVVMLGSLGSYVVVTLGSYEDIDSKLGTTDGETLGFLLGGLFEGFLEVGLFEGGAFEGFLVVGLFEGFFDVFFEGGPTFTLGVYDGTGLIVGV